MLLTSTEPGFPPPGTSNTSACRRVEVSKLSGTTGFRSSPVTTVIRYLIFTWSLTDWWFISIQTQYHCSPG